MFSTADIRCHIIVMIHDKTIMMPVTASITQRGGPSFTKYPLLPISPKVEMEHSQTDAKNDGSHFVPLKN